MTDTETDLGGEPTGSSRTAWILYGPTGDLGMALTAVAVIGFDGDDHHISWIPRSPSDNWQRHYAGAQERINVGAATWADTIDYWLESANGYSANLEQVAIGDGSLRDEVEALVDELMALPPLPEDV